VIDKNASLSSEALAKGETSGVSDDGRSRRAPKAKRIRRHASPPRTVIVLPWNSEYGLRTEVYVYGSDIYLSWFWFLARLAACSPRVWCRPTASADAHLFIAIRSTLRRKCRSMLKENHRHKPHPISQKVLRALLLLRKFLVASSTDTTRPKVHRKILRVLCITGIGRNNNERQ